MWVVKGKTSSGQSVEYKVPAPKDTDKAFVLAMAFQEHGTKNAGDPLTTQADVTWTSDSVTRLAEEIKLSEGSNYGVDKRVKKGVWERFSKRAFRSYEAAVEAMESAASEYPKECFRIVATYTETMVLAASKNAMDVVGEKADEPATADESKVTAEADAPKPGASKPGATTAAKSKNAATAA